MVQPTVKYLGAGRPHVYVDTPFASEDQTLAQWRIAQDAARRAQRAQARRTKARVLASLLRRA